MVFAVGIGAYFSLHSEPHAALFPAIGLGAGGLWLSCRANRAHPTLGILAHIMVSLMIVAAGASIAQFRTMNMDTAAITKRIGPTSIEGRVLRLETFPDAYRVILHHPKIAGLPAHGTPSRARVRFRGDAGGLSPGTWIRFRGILSPPSAPMAPGAFDFQRHAFFKGIGAIGFAVSAPNVLFAEKRQGLAVRFEAVRHRVTQRVIAALPADIGGIAAALITGERSAVSVADLEAIRDSGLAHLLAISGLHIGLVAGLIFVFSRAVWAAIPGFAINYPIKKWAAVMAMVGAFIYAVLAGATLPTQRALLMISLALLGVLLDRRGLSLRSVAWAAMIVLTIQPESLLGASFQMSFAAVVALIAAYEHFSDRRRTDPVTTPKTNTLRNKLGRYLAGIACTTLIATAATAPFAIYHFNRIADYGLMANLLAVPVTGLWVMPWAIISLLAMPLDAEAWTLQPMGWGIQVILGVAHEVASWPGAVTIVPSIPDWALICAALGGIWLCLWKGPARMFGAFGILAGAISLSAVTPPDILISGDGKILAIRGQGDAWLFSSVRGSRFQREIWLRRSGAKAKNNIIPPTGKHWRGDLNCDVSGCVLRKHGHTIALVRSEHGAREDCGRVDLIIALFPLYRQCHRTRSIDRFDLWRHGAHAVSINRSVIRIATVAGTRGDRPWVIRSQDRAGRRHLDRQGGPKTH